MEAAASPFINSSHHQQQQHHQQHHNQQHHQHHQQHHQQGEHNSSSSTAGASKRAACNLGEPENGSILDPFQIEDLLDFSNEDIAGPIGDEHGSAAMPQPSSNNNSTITAVSSVDTKDATTTTRAVDIGSTEFPLECDDMPELEWLSSLVEDDTFAMGDASAAPAAAHKNVLVGSCSPVSSSANVGTTTHLLSTLNTAGSKRQHPLLLDDSSSHKVDRFQVGSPISVLESSSATSGSRLGVKDMAVPGRPRSKRMRTGVNSWKSSPPPAATKGVCSIGTNTTATIAANKSINNNKSSSNMTNINASNANNNNNMSSCSPDTSSVSDYNNNKSEPEQNDSGFSLDNSLSSEQDVVDSRPLNVSAHLKQQQQQHQQYASLTTATTPAVASSKGKPPLLKNSTTTTSSLTPAAAAGSGAGSGPGSAPGPTAAAAAAAGGQEPRRCTHCLSQKTPQWRAGPEGPKTLCNACGVRFKSGRLFPEYRPALSPTFVSDLHSNSHRKVLEMRKQKQSQVPHFQMQHQHHQGEVLDEGEQLLIYK